MYRYLNAALIKSSFVQIKKYAPTYSRFRETKLLETFLFSNANNYNHPSFRYVTVSVGAQVCNETSNPKTDLLNKPRVYASDILESLGTKVDVDHALLLLRHCSEAILDNRCNLTRPQLCSTIWENLSNRTDVNQSTELHKAYLQACIKTFGKVDSVSFLSKINGEPDRDTYKLLLECACQRGDLQEALQVVQVMKDRDLPADLGVFNALILGHAVNGGLSEAEDVFKTMKTAQISATITTHLSLLRGLAIYGNEEEFFKIFNLHRSNLNEKDVLQLILLLGLTEKYEWIKKMWKIFSFDSKLSKQYDNDLNVLCIRFVHARREKVAMFCYKLLREPQLSESEGKYASFLLNELLFSKIPIDSIIKIADDLKASELNVLALEKVTGFALYGGFVDEAWTLLNERFTILRPHYFWPLLIAAGRQRGEAGIFECLRKMLNKGIRPTYDTTEFYCLPYCDIKNCLNLMERFKQLNLSPRELVTPTLKFLIKRQKLQEAVQLWTKYETEVKPEQILSVLVKAWKTDKQSEYIVQLLKKVSKHSAVSYDSVGQFILEALRSCNSLVNHERFLKLITDLKYQQLSISPTKADSLMYMLNQELHQCAVTETIKTTIESLIDNSTLRESHGLIPHPRDMNPTELENHLIELQSKGMETRGVLRRLIQQHARTGNSSRVTELRRQFIDSNYQETAGMKASLFHTYVTCQNVKDALEVYKELKRSHSNFVLDEFKYLDFAALLVKNGQFDEAISFLQNETRQRRVRGGPAIIRNCWRLLGAVEDDANQLEKLYAFLTEKGYCKPSNIILGPRVKFYLKKKELTNATNVYEEACSRYNCTPLQLELMIALAAEEKYKSLLRRVVHASTKVHGSANSTVMLISSYAENGLQDDLQQYILEVNEINPDEINRRCTRWVTEKKLLPLETLIKALENQPKKKIDPLVIYRHIMQIHSNNNDCESAVEFYQRLAKKEQNVPQEVVNEMLKLVQRCKYKMPDIL